MDKKKEKSKNPIKFLGLVAIGMGVKAVEWAGGKKVINQYDDEDEVDVPVVPREPCKKHL